MENKNISFEIDSDFIELIKLLKVVGACNTGGQAKMEVEAGNVMVDNEVESRKRRKVRKGMTVKFDGYVIKVV
jgi:ribosome-associated protein